MTRTSILFFLFTIISGFTFTQQPTFQRKLKANNLVFEMPKGYIETPSANDKNPFSEFTIEKGGEDFTVIYEIYSLKKELKKHKKNLKKPHDKMMHPNYIWKLNLNARIDSLIKEKDKKNIREFEEEAFNENFIGDAGGVCFYSVDPAKNSNYKYAITMAIHQNFVADVYITFLSNDMDKLQDYSLEVFHAMRFKTA